MNQLSQSTVASIASEISLPPDVWSKRARFHLDTLTKPPGSLGRLEDIATQMVAIRQENSSQPSNKAVYVFAADHGITAEGVSAFPREVTYQMVLNFLTHGAAINVLAKLHHAEINVVDVGVNADFHAASNLLHYKVRRGTRNMLREAAMTHDELGQALAAGIELANAAKEKGQTLLAVGEMGIGNTTAASAITSALTHSPAAQVTGKGAGLDRKAQTRKCQIVEAILSHHFGPRIPDLASATTLDPLEILRRVGGLEIAAMTGFILGAARHHIAVIADGFISTSAAALAFTIAPQVRAYLFAGHRSDEPGHCVLLEYIGLEPILSLNMRLGEGTGAVLAMPVIESALCLYNEMATFSSAGVSGANQ